nr:immunoglobulin light chain junction region [Macaca mulatta]
CLQDYRNPLTF